MGIGPRADTFWALTGTILEACPEVGIGPRADTFWALTGTILEACPEVGIGPRANTFWALTGTILEACPEVGIGPRTCRPRFNTIPIAHHRLPKQSVVCIIPSWSLVSVEYMSPCQFK